MITAVKVMPITSIKSYKIVISVGPILLVYDESTQLEMMDGKMGCGAIRLDGGSMSLPCGPSWMPCGPWSVCVHQPSYFFKL